MTQGPGNYLNLGILAHVDAGKTSLTERLLHHAGVIDRPGSVDDGSTQSDSMDLERRRGITIRSAVVSFAIDDLTVNLIDTPGHADFVAEVERALSVLDGAVLVVSAVEGVQAQTRVLMRILKRLAVPTVIFVNKIDRVGARPDALLDDIARKLTPAALPMGAVADAGTKAARTTARDLADPAFAQRAAEALADHSTEFLTAYLDDPIAIAPSRYRAEIARQCGLGLLHPVYFGSAALGIGIADLVSGIKAHLTPAPAAPDGGPRGSVFKVEHDRGEKIAFVRMRGGTLRPRARPFLYRRTLDGEVKRFQARITGVEVFARGALADRADAVPGSIAKVRGLDGVRIGDALGSADDLPPGGLFATPTLETVISPTDPGRRRELHAALTALSEREPLARPDLDGSDGQMRLTLYGEVQQQVVAAILNEEFGLDVAFEEVRTVHLERPIGTGAAVEEIGLSASTGFIATVGLRVEPAPEGSGIAYRIEVHRGSLPRACHNAIEETVRDTLRDGLHGWRVADAAVALTHSGHISSMSTVADFRQLTPIVLRRALAAAGTEVLEPVYGFELDVPEALSAPVRLAVAESGGMILGCVVRGLDCTLTGTMPARSITRFERGLPSLTQGEASFVSHLDGWRPVVGPPPERKRPAGSGRP